MRTQVLALYSPSYLVKMYGILGHEAWNVEATMSWVWLQLGVLCTNLSSTVLRLMICSWHSETRNRPFTYNSSHTISFQHLVPQTPLKVNYKCYRPHHPCPPLLLDLSVAFNLKILLIIVVSWILRLDYNSRKKIFRFRLSKQGYATHVMVPDHTATFSKKDPNPVSILCKGDLFKELWRYDNELEEIGPRILTVNDIDAWDGVVCDGVKWKMKPSEGKRKGVYRQADCQLNSIEKKKIELH